MGHVTSITTTVDVKWSDYMLDSFLEKLRVTDAWRDYFDEVNKIVEQIIGKIIGYDWVSIGRKL